MRRTPFPRERSSALLYVVYRFLTGVLQVIHIGMTDDHGLKCGLGTVVVLVSFEYNGVLLDRQERQRNS